jgi:hypothetical protein
MNRERRYFGMTSVVMILDRSLSMPMNGLFLPPRSLAIETIKDLERTACPDHLCSVAFGPKVEIIEPFQMAETEWVYEYGSSLADASDARGLYPGRSTGPDCPLLGSVPFRPTPTSAAKSSSSARLPGDSGSDGVRAPFCSRRLGNHRSAPIPQRKPATKKMLSLSRSLTRSSPPGGIVNDTYVGSNF